jgi:hypothetical protein
MDAEAFRRFEQVGHDRLAATYADFFLGNTARAVEPLLEYAWPSSGSRPPPGAPDRGRRLCENAAPTARTHRRPSRRTS